MMISQTHRANILLLFLAQDELRNIILENMLLFCACQPKASKGTHSKHIKIILHVPVTQT